MNNKNLIFYPWLHNKDKDYASFSETPKSIKRKSYLLTEGERCSEWFPGEVAFDCDVDNPSTRLPDSIFNNSLLLIVSEKLKELIENNTTTEIEFLKIFIRNHKKRKVEKTYFIANVLKTISCMDRNKSDYENSSLDKSQVHHIKHLVLDENKIPKEINIFRLGEENDLILVREDLVKVIESSGLTGLQFGKIEDYGKQYRRVDRMALLKYWDTQK